MTSTTLTLWHATTNTTVTHRLCAVQAAHLVAANMVKVYFRGLCIDSDVGP